VFHWFCAAREEYFTNIQILHSTSILPGKTNGCGVVVVVVMIGRIG